MSESIRRHSVLVGLLTCLAFFLTGIIVGRWSRALEEPPITAVERMHVQRDGSGCYWLHDTGTNTTFLWMGPGTSPVVVPDPTGKPAQSADFG